MKKITCVSSLSDKDISYRLFGKRITTKLNTGLADCKKLSYEDLLLAGLTVREADTVYLTFEANRRAVFEESRKQDKTHIRSSEHSADIMKSLIGDSAVEQFWVIYLNRTNRIIDVIKISEGGINGTVADPRIILKKAITLNACALILSHNHPSGVLRPSQEDIKLTSNIKDAARLMNINTLDHIIVSSVGYYSFADEGII